jgi:hypothetical protein
MGHLAISQVKLLLLRFLLAQRLPTMFQPFLKCLTSFPIIDLHLSAQGCKNMDAVMKSNSICILFIEQKRKWGGFSRTEVAWNNPFSHLE